MKIVRTSSTTHTKRMNDTRRKIIIKNPRYTKNPPLKKLLLYRVRLDGRVPLVSPDHFGTEFSTRPSCLFKTWCNVSAPTICSSPRAQRDGYSRNGLD